MKRFSSVLLLILFVLLPGSLSASEGPIWKQVAERDGLAAFEHASRLKFTWHHLPKDISRSYDWNLRTNQVRVTMHGKTVTIPAYAKGLKGDKLAASKAFINDSYWLLFELKAVTDYVGRSDLGEVDSPFGRLHAYRIQYPPKGGYTPGDAYVVYVGPKSKVVGWEYHPGGAAKARVITTREGRKTLDGVNLPTQFKGPDGKLVIEITGLSLQ